MTQRRYNFKARKYQEYSREKNKMFIQAEREGWTQEKINEKHKELVKKYKL